MVGCSEALAAVWRAIKQFGPYRTTVLVQGETGTGKDLVAQALHQFGSSPKGPFVVFNCCNLVDALAESQLFGHVRGAFTDAREDSEGYFRAANGGTLFLDEVGELPLSLQGKLLRAVETLEVQPVGSLQSFHLNVRIVAATNRDLRAMVKARQFRADLFYRLNNVSISVPPLRERMADLEPILEYFIRHYSDVLNKPITTISEQALEALRRHRWPGNVREVANLVEGAILLSPGTALDLDSFSSLALEDSSGDSIEPAPNLTQFPAPARATGLQPVTERRTAAADGLREPLTLKEIMRDALLAALDKTGGNRYRAAELLAVSRSTFYRMMARYEVEDGKSVRAAAKGTNVA